MPGRGHEVDNVRYTVMSVEETDEAMDGTGMREEDQGNMPRRVTEAKESVGVVSVGAWAEDGGPLDASGADRHVQTTASGASPAAALDNACDAVTSVEEIDQAIDATGTEPREDMPRRETGAKESAAISPTAGILRYVTYRTTMTQG